MYKMVRVVLYILYCFWANIMQLTIYVMSARCDTINAAKIKDTNKNDNTKFTVNVVIDACIYRVKDISLYDYISIYKR